MKIYLGGETKDLKYSYLTHAGTGRGDDAEVFDHITFALLNGNMQDKQNVNCHKSLSVFETMRKIRLNVNVENQDIMLSTKDVENKIKVFM